MPLNKKSLILELSESLVMRPPRISVAVQILVTKQVLHVTFTPFWWLLPRDKEMKTTEPYKILFHLRFQLTRCLHSQVYFLKYSNHNSLDYVWPK